MVLDTIVASHDTVILSMHDVGLALACTDRVVGIRNGRIVLDESTAGMNSGDLDALYRTDA